MNKLISFLNGKKTAIGTALLFLAMFLSQVIETKWGYNPGWLDNTIETLDWLGGVLLGTGVVHKMMKPGIEEAKPQ